MLFVAGQVEDGAALFVSIPLGAAGAVALPADILRAGRLPISAAFNHASFQRCGQIGGRVHVPD